MKKMRTLLAVLLSFTLCVSLLVPAMADEVPGDTGNTDNGPTENAPAETNKTITKECTLEEHAEHANQDGWVCVPVYVDNKDLGCVLDAHTHSAECQPLICVKAEHEHSDECYAPAEEEGGEPTVICGKEEHKHTAECYDACKVAEHTHSDGEDSTCKFAQKLDHYLCTYNEPQKFENGEETAPSYTHRTDGTYNGDYVYVYIEPNSMGDANLDMDNLAPGSSYGSYGRFVVPTDIEKGVKDMTSAEFNQFMKEQIAAGKIQVWENGKVVEKELSKEQKDALNKVVWVHVAVSGQGGADGWSHDEVPDTIWTTHADGHVHDVKHDENHLDSSASIAPTCTTPGCKVYKCMRVMGGTDDATKGFVCTYTETDYVAPLGHDFPANEAGHVTQKDASCHTLTCEHGCGTTIEVPHTLSTGDWTEWKLDSETHKETRTRTVSCFCGYSYTETQTRLQGQVTVTVNYVAGNRTLDTVSQSGYPGFSYTTEIKDFRSEGLTTDRTSETYVINEDTVIEIPYTQIDYYLTVIHSYRNAAGTEVARVNSDPVVYHYGDTYSTSSLARTGYVLSGNEGDPVSGTFGAKDITVTYVYSPAPAPDDPTPTPTPTPIEEEVDEPDVPLVEEPPVEDIEEPEVPLEEEPDIEIEEPDVPLAEVPETGDGSGLWFVSAVLSAMGLVLLFFTRKREGQEG